MQAIFLQDAELNIMEAHEDPSDPPTKVTFKKGTSIEFEEIESDDSNDWFIDIQFADGSVALDVNREWLNLRVMVAYNDKLSPEQQIDTKEEISALIYQYQSEMIKQQEEECEDQTLTDEDCNELADLILYKVLREFRPDLFEDYKKA